MKKIYSYILLMIMSFAFVLVGCGTGLSMPKSTAKVYGNGGTVVQKGEYLYFTNAYTTYSSLANDVSNGDKNKEYGIYRVKLTSINNVGIDFNENNFANNVEKITSKLAGFESSGLYIVGDYLFFASPNMHKTKTNENKFDYITFFSIKLDGSGLKELYTTSSSTNADWKIYEIKNKNYLITVENEKIIRHEISKNSLANKTILVDNAKNVVLAKNIISDFDHDIYYIRDFSEKQKEENFLSGDVFEKVNIVTASKKVINETTGQSTSILAHENSRLFYKNDNTIANESGVYVLGQTSSSMRISFNSSSKAELFFMGEGKPLVYKAGSKVWMQYLTQENTIDVPNYDSEILVNENATVLFVTGDYVYYSLNDSLCRISYLNREAQTIIEGATENKNIDFDGRYLYVYKTLEAGESQIKYLHRVDTYTVETAGEAKFETVGYVLKADVEAKIKADKDAEEVENN